MAYKLLLKPLFLCIFLSSSPACLGFDLIGTLLPVLVNSANEIDRLFRLVTGRPDFNKFFLTKAWDLKNTAENEYDFIIVGSGSAGSVIANRLSENKNWKILLLECGIPETGFMGIPVLAAAFQFTPYNWKYYMEPQKYTFNGLNDNRMHWPRGKALGGTTVINYMIYTRGNKWDYDRWAADGNPGWSYKDVLPYFIKSEKAYNLRDSDPAVHGTTGYQSVENSYRSKLTDIYLEAGPYVNLTKFDYNANKEPYGVAQFQATIKRGRRESVASSFLWPVRDRPNLDIIIGAFVTKVLIHAANKTAYGVTYEKNGIEYTVYAKKEVILSAGAFMSPQLLMLAGIGPKQHLEQLKIPVLADLPVGRNLHDHLCYPGMSFEIDEPLDLNPVRLVLSTGEYLQNGTGPYASLGGVEAIGYIKTKLATYQEDYPDMELIFGGATIAADAGTAIYRSMNIRDDVFAKTFAPLIIRHAWSIIPMLLHPKSIGYMELRSTNPRDYPKFYGNFFTDPEDLDLRRFLEALRFIQNISATPPFQKIGSRLNTRPLLTCQHLPFDSDDYWKCCLKSISVTLHHQVGTAKMGPDGVVNHNLQVHGVTNLRVADCSVIPMALSAHTNAPSMMVGEKASDIIKDYWKNK